MPRMSSNRSRVQAVAYGALLSIAYVVAAEFGFRLAFLAEQVTTVWAPTGIAIAALTIGGATFWPAVWVGAFLVNADTQAPLWTAPLIATGNTLEAVATSILLRRLVPAFDIGFRRVADVLWFVAIAAGCSAISASIGVTTLSAASVQPWDRFAMLWSDWWIGDALGAVLVAPAILTVVAESWSRRAAVQTALFVSVAAAVAYVVFSQRVGPVAHPLEFVVFPVVIAAAVIGGTGVTSWVVLTACAVAVWHTVDGLGPFAGPDRHLSLVVGQVFMGVLGITGMLLAAAIAERRSAEQDSRDSTRALQEREEMLRLAQRAGGVAAFEWDFRNQVAHCSAEFFRIFGLPAHDGRMTGSEWADFVHPEDRARMATHLARALAGVEPAVADYRIHSADGHERWLTYSGHVQRTPGGDRMLGTVLDITERKRLEGELRRHAAEVEHILERIGEGFVALDQEFRYVYVNQSAERMLGVTRTQVIGSTPWEVFSDDIVRESKRQFEAAMEERAPRRYETYVATWNRWYEARVYPSATGLSVFFSDVTVRVEADAALRESRDVLSLAMRGGSMGAWSRNLSTDEVWWSPQLEELFGLPAGEFARTEAGFFEFIHPDDRGAVRAAVDSAVGRNSDYVVEFRFRRADVPGEWRWMEGRGRAVYQKDGTPRTLYGIGIDVTDRKRTEMALQAAKVAAERDQRRLEDVNQELRRRINEQETLLDVLPVGIGIASDRECRVIRTNRAFSETLGLAPAQNASKTAPPHERPTRFRVFTPQGEEIADQELPMQVAAREGRDVRDLEIDIVREDGRTIRLLEYAAPLLDEHGTPRGAVGVFVDVTEVHRARGVLARSEERYRRIFNATGVSLWEEDFSAVRLELERLRASRVQDLEAYLRTHPEFVDECVRRVKIIDVNEATLDMFGAGSKDVLLQSLERIFRPETRGVFIGELVAFARGDRRFESEALVSRLDGQPLHVLVSVTFPSPTDTSDHVLISLADITARKIAETALQQEVEVRTALAQVGASLAQELRSERLVQAVTDAATALTEAEFGAFFYSAADEKGAAYQLYALSGAPREAFDHFPHPRATDIFGPTFRGEAVVRIDDVTRDARYGRHAPFYGMPEGHLPVRSYLAVPVIGRGGSVLGGLIFGHSESGVFTERHELLASGVAGWAAIALDNARLYQDAENANRLKDEFLATLSHELRTPLNAVLGWAHLLRQGVAPPSMHQRAVEAIHRNARLQARLVEDLLDVSRIMTGKLQINAGPVDLGTVIRDAVDTVRAGVAAKGLSLLVDVPSDRRITVTGDAGRLQQIVWNLVSNAIKFTPSGGRVGVELRQTESLAVVTVRDTGQGIDPSFRPFLFQRFSQLDPSKAPSQGGLGLGLSIVRHLAEAHGGAVRAESDGPGRGSTFSVTLPLRAVEEVPPPADDGARPVTAFAGLRVLTVNDSLDIREQTRAVLEKHGAVVRSASSTGEALHVLTTEHCDVVVAGLGAAEQDSLALIRIIRELPTGSLNRDVPALAITVDGADAAEAVFAAGFTRCLRQPFDVSDLVGAVARLVTGETSAATDDRQS